MPNRRLFPGSWFMVLVALLCLPAPRAQNLATSPVHSDPRKVDAACFGQQFTLVTDGVVEARDKTGALFGFDRTAALSTQPAEAIAQTAQVFGQEDDITVLTLAFIACP